MRWALCLWCARVCPLPTVFMIIFQASAVFPPRNSRSHHLLLKITKPQTDRESSFSHQTLSFCTQFIQSFLGLLSHPRSTATLSNVGQALSYNSVKQRQQQFTTTITDLAASTATDSESVTNSGINQSMFYQFCVCSSQQKLRVTDASPQRTLSLSQK